MTTQTMSHDPAGWTNYCPQCGAAYWAAWQASGGHVKRMDWREREKPHVCDTSRKVTVE